MKIAVTSLGESLESPVDQRFGRARFFVLFDLETNEWTTHENNLNVDADQGAGVRAAQRVADLGAETVITGHCGPQAFKALKAAEMDVYQGASGSVMSAIGQYRSGSLKIIGRPDVEAGYGSV
jgi:predicted Fe-Mo cluster-binding NifX family protein